MKKNLCLTLLATLFLASPLLARDPVRTIVVRDGKMLQDGRLINLDGLLAFPRVYLGVSLIELTPELRKHYGAAGESGVLVSEVAESGPAAKAGVRVGDIIVAVDGQPVDSSGDVRRLLSDKEKGASARIELIRDRTRQTVVAAVAERERVAVDTVPLENLTRELAERFESPEWKARIERFGDCGDLQTRIRDLETRLRDLEKKLPK